MIKINQIHSGKKTVCITLAAFLLGSSIPAGNCLADEAVPAAVQPIEDATAYPEQTTDDTTDDIVSETTEAVSVSSGGIVSGGSLTTASYTAAKSQKHLKLNFSYQLLGCVQVDSRLNVRKSPGTSAKIVSTVTNNTFCNVLSIENGWAKIKSGKLTGYISADYLLTGEKAEQLALKKAEKSVKVIRTSVLNIRSLPSTDTSIYGKAKKGRSFSLASQAVTKARIQKLLKKNKSLRRRLSTKERKKMLSPSNLKKWVCVKYNGKTAFISKEYTELIYTVKTAVTQNRKTSSLRKRIVKYAKKFLGNRYVYGGSSLKHGTDCSGFVMRIYQHFGYKLSRSSAAQSTNGKKISRSRLKPGDLLFYKRGGRIGHVSMYIGSGKVIHASNKKTGITISNIHYRRACRYVKIIKD